MEQYLDPAVSRAKLTDEEGRLIFELAGKDGKNWALITKKLPGRTQGKVKNYYYNTIRKNIRRVNKSLILKECIKGSVDELINDPVISDLVICIYSECLKKIKEFKGILNAEEKYLYSGDQEIEPNQVTSELYLLPGIKTTIKFVAIAYETLISLNGFFV